MVRCFISFSGLLRAMNTRTVVAADLDTALFAFNCAREHLDKTFEENEDTQRTFAPWRGYGENGCVIYASIQQAIIKAESAGRCSFPGKGTDNWQRLDDLLIRNGFYPISPFADNIEHYNYRTILEAAMRSAQALEVIRDESTSSNPLLPSCCPTCENLLGLPVILPEEGDLLCRLLNVSQNQHFEWYLYPHLLVEAGSGHSVKGVAELFCSAVGHCEENLSKIGASSLQPIIKKRFAGQYMDAMIEDPVLAKAAEAEVIRRF